jgi:hypothetical protein
VHCTLNLVHLISIVSNFTFSENLEISVLEHRLKQLFEILEKINTKYFYPSLLFNESFWQAPLDKRISILAHAQYEWLGEKPLQKSSFYKDEIFLELLNSLKVTNFSYSKITLENLIDLLKTKTKFSITQFAPFSDKKEGAVRFLNNIFFGRGFSFDEFYEDFNEINEFDTPAKIAAVKFYAKFTKHTKINALFISIHNNANYIETFLKSLSLIDQKKGTDLLSKSKFFLTDEYQISLDNISENLDNYPTLKKLYDSEQIVLDRIDLNDLDFKEKFDYIFICYGLSIQPTEILINHSNIIYRAVSRLTYINRENPEDAVKKVAEFESPMQDYSNIEADDLIDVDFEVIFDEYKNQRIVDLVDKNYGFPEGKYLKFSENTLSFLVKSIKSLHKDGYIEVWDLNEPIQDLFSIGISRLKKYGGVLIPINFGLYTKILESLSDVKCDFSIQSVNEVISREILADREVFVPLYIYIKFLLGEPEKWKATFNIDNFLLKKELLKQARFLRFFETLKRKRIFFFGLPQFLYNIGFEKFKKKILNHPELSKFINKDNFLNNRIGRYVNEYFVSLTTGVLSGVHERGFTVITNDMNSPHNKNFFEYLEVIGFEKEGIMKVINESWAELGEFSQQNTRLSLFEIINKS